MYSIILENGKRISGNTWKEVVRNLKNSTYFFTRQSIEEYMAGVADRVQELRQEQIQYTDAESFIHELERVEIIRVVKMRRMK